MLAIIKQSKLPYLLCAVIGSWIHGVLTCLIVGLYVTDVLKVRIYGIATNFVFYHLKVRHYVIELNYC